MKKVIIISTEHMQNGNCNPDALFQIIESIRPDVIFVEEPNDDKYWNYFIDVNSFKPLEIQTIIKFKEKYNIADIPIDKEINEYASLYLLGQFTTMFNRFPEIQNIIREHCTLRNEYGFNYLNSNECSKLHAKKLATQLEIISRMGQDKNILLDLYHQWLEEIDLREKTMLEKIYAYSEATKYSNAVFLLGYAHRESIRKKIPHDSRVQWMFYNE